MERGGPLGYGILPGGHGNGGSTLERELREALDAALVQGNIRVSAAADALKGVAEHASRIGHPDARALNRLADRWARMWVETMASVKDAARESPLVARIIAE